MFHQNLRECDICICLKFIYPAPLFLKNNSAFAIQTMNLLGENMKVAVLGCGVMGMAFARHFVKKHPVILCDRDQIKTLTFAKEIGAVFQEKMDVAVREADVVLLAVKPKDLAEIAHATASAFTKDKILISILAGVPVAHLKKS